MKNVRFSSHLMGGLGNQMFQISHALAQSWRHSADCHFPMNSETPGNGRQPHNYFNNIFKKLKFSDNNSFDLILREKHFNDPDIRIVPNKSIKFWGYFQGSHNFRGFENEIKNIFSPDDNFINKINQKYPELIELSTSIHVRRGDYLTISDVLPIIDKSYFDYCKNEIENPGKIFIFTNDKDWVSHNLNYENCIIVSDLEDYEELWMMSLCKNNIISNSSFSWWASYLNTNPNKKVMAPNLWFGPRGLHPHNNIYEPEWCNVDVFYQNGFLKKK